METEDEIIVALLHDVVEDTAFTLDDIRAWGFGHLADAIDCLTKRKDETYREFISRVCNNRLATAVKIADMRHNLSRIDALPENERGLADRYNKWLPVLEAESKRQQSGLLDT
jgi:(p)ppGpp synthase/HD superfamily hydrolase